MILFYIKLTKTFFFTITSTAARAIEELRTFPLFKAVDPALKSERYQENHPNDQNQKKQQVMIIQETFIFPMVHPIS